MSRNTEEEVRAALETAEREIALLRVLVREGDHRLKNSLQVVSSLAAMQARKAAGEAATAFKHLASQIAAIAEVHDNLQLNEGESVDLGVVLPRICAALQRMSDGKPLTIACEVESIVAPSSIAQPLALTVNELLLNALEHAFADDQPGTIRIEARVRDDQLTIIVADDGNGIPENASAPAARGFGMRMVRTLLSKIGGELSIENKGGAQLTITVPFADAGA